MSRFLWAMARSQSGRRKQTVLASFAIPTGRCASDCEPDIDDCEPDIESKQVRIK